MATNIEIEAKVLITKDEYKRVLAHYIDSKFRKFEQDNYYIDTKNFTLKKLGIGLRVRFLDDIYTMTLKVPLSEGLLEKEQIISKEEYETLKNDNVFPKGKLKEYIIMLGINIEELKILTTLSTLRIEIDLDEGKLCIDKNEYSDMVDYELELEGNALSVVKLKLQEICKENNIVYKDNLISKQSRAMSKI